MKEREDIFLEKMTWNIASSKLGAYPGYEAIGPQEIINAFSEGLTTLLDPTRTVDPDLFEGVRDTILSSVREQIPNMGTAVQGDECIIFFNTSAIVIGSSRETAEQPADIFRQFAENSQEGDAKAAMWYLDAEERFAQKASDSIGTEVIERQSPDNLETRVQNHLRSQLCPAIDSNVSMKFAEQVVESREFDALIHLSANARIYVEVKDATHDGADLGKTELVTVPNDNADRIRKYVSEQRTGAFPDSDRTEVAVVVRGMDSRRFTDLEAVAANRDISLLEYDEDGVYVNELETVAKKLLLEQVLPW